MKLTAIFILSFLTLHSTFAATPTACGYDYWPEADMYRVIKETAQDIKKCKGQLLDDMGECVDKKGNVIECRLDV